MKDSTQRGESRGPVAAPDEAASCVYELDTALHLVGVDSAWTAFAMANGAPELVPPACLHRSVLSSIADATTAEMYRQLFERVRLHERLLRFPIRCDSPSRRRFLELSIGRRAGGFRLESVMLRAEAREPVELLEARRPDDGTLLRVCSWCKVVDAGGEWLEVEDAVDRLRLFEQEALPRLTHTICERCYARMESLLR